MAANKARSIFRRFQENFQRSEWFTGPAIGPQAEEAQVGLRDQFTVPKDRDDLALAPSLDALGQVIKTRQAQRRRNSTSGPDDEAHVRQSRESGLDISPAEVDGILGTGLEVPESIMPNESHHTTDNLLDSHSGRVRYSWEVSSRRVSSSRAQALPIQSEYPLFKLIGTMAAAEQGRLLYQIPAITCLVACISLAYSLISPLIFWYTPLSENENFAAFVFSLVSLAASSLWIKTYPVLYERQTTTREKIDLLEAHLWYVTGMLLGQGLLLSRLLLVNLVREGIGLQLIALVGLDVVRGVELCTRFHILDGLHLAQRALPLS